MDAFSRRSFLQRCGATLAFGALASTLPARFTYAATPGNKRLLVVILRGALDGLAAVVPYGDPSYADARGAMALPQNDAALVALDAHFALHTALAPLAQLFAQRELLVLHAAATPYRERSHFDAQNLLESGGVTPHALDTGWLNRSIEALGSSPKAMAIGPAIPLLLRGDARVASWAPSVLPNVDDAFLMRVREMYGNDALLMNALETAQEMHGGEGMGGSARGQRAFIDMMKKAATFMNGSDGASIGTVEMGGWDTHANQGLEKGRLSALLGILSEGLLAYRSGMGTAWSDTAVLVVTEFGRTVKGNGSGGTDHGTASVAFLLGGNVNGGRVIGEWPGLSRLYQDRDLMPVNDLRGLLKGTLHQHLGIADAQLDSTVFPDSKQAPELSGLFRA